ncbi:GTP pyrophosphokinase [Kribbella catacumbae]|uniref:GTP pyrophosphokinase n=1 Tax=Kribbella catacumbae TaxID=460086 RepID=UPI00036A8280|nr:GTP pyrophosphokinase family protein [Kribbella catacumbae]
MCAVDAEAATDADGTYHLDRSLGGGSGLARFLMPYKFGLDEIMTKVNILSQELTLTHDYNPIEHVKSRLKSADSILEKTQRIGCGTTAADIRANITDLAGIRIVCSFTTDVYEVGEMLTSQADVELLRTRDYIAAPKSNGYRSLHLLVEVPVFLSDRVEAVCVELQLRTVAMDFWASLEHKAVYKYRGQVPASVSDELQQAAEITRSLDSRIESLRSDILRRH